MAKITTDPRVGVGVIVFKDGKVLMGLRTGSHAANVWAFPGGSVDPGETPVATAVRELFEETGLRARAIRTLPYWSNDLFPEDNKHFITLYFLIEAEGGDPVIVEPHKCLEWRYCPIDNLPTPYFTGIDGLLATLDLKQEMTKFEHDHAFLDPEIGQGETCE